MAQVTPPGNRGIGRGTLGLIALLSACSPPEPPPVSGPVAGPTIAGALSEASALIAPHDNTPTPVDSPEPMGAWVVVHRLEELHATWTDFGAQSAVGPVADTALVPYADAVTHHGESWGLATGSPELILSNAQGHAYRYPAGRHGVNPKQEHRLRVEAAELDRWGWAALETGKNLQVDYAGNTLHLLGALRATGTCGSCHADVGEKLLGAYRYTLNEIADD